MHGSAPSPPVDKLQRTAPLTPCHLQLCLGHSSPHSGGCVFPVCALRAALAARWHQQGPQALTLTAMPATCFAAMAAPNSRNPPRDPQALTLEAVPDEWLALMAVKVSSTQVWAEPATRPLCPAATVLSSRTTTFLPAGHARQHKAHMFKLQTEYDLARQRQDKSLPDLHTITFSLK